MDVLSAQVITEQPAPKRHALKYFAIGIALVAALALTIVIVTRYILQQVEPVISTNGKLLSSNPAVNGKTGWNFADVPVVAAYDEAVTHTADGSGSIRFDSGMRQSDQIVLTPDAGKLNVSAWVKQDSGEIGTMTIKVTSMDYETTYSTTTLKPSKNGAWTEVRTSYNLPTGVDRVRFILERGLPQPNNSPMWLDDIRMSHPK